MTDQQVATGRREHSNEQSQDSSPSSSISLVKLDELSSFGATKQNRLPALIKLQSLENQQQPLEQQQANSMPAFNMDQMEQMQASTEKVPTSLPAQVLIASEPANVAQVDKENQATIEESDDFQVVDMISTDAVMMGPSLPPPKEQQESMDASKLPSDIEQQMQRQVLASSQLLTNQYPSHLGDSLIEMVINLRNENQNLVRALETNNEYVKERLNEFKRSQEEAKKREAQFAMEKADHEHQARKLQRQNTVLSERLKSMEAKLKDMKLEVSESLNAAHSSKASSLRGDQNSANLYPQLADSESFTNAELHQATTMQIDAASGELLNNEDSSSSSGSSSSGEAGQQNSPGGPPMDTDAGPSGEGAKVGSMTKEELSKRFDANKVQFYALDDPMKQCDELEKQLNDIGKRDYEICLLQQQLNIYRQDFRLERMAKLEAKIQIEKLKYDIDRLCLERIQDHQTAPKNLANEEDARDQGRRHSRHRSFGGHRNDPAVAAAEAVIGKLGHQLGKKAAKSAAKAAKYAAKQALKDEKAAFFAAATSAAAAAAAANSNANAQTQPQAPPPGAEYYGHHHRRHHGHHHRPRGVRSEVVNDLLSTANKAMLTGYKMASTHVNLALDKLSAYEQAQASNLAQNKPAGTSNEPSAPMQPPSID